MNFDFSIRAWAAFAPGLSMPSQWRVWAAAPFVPAGDAPPAVTEMPAMSRRRLGSLGRTAVQVAYDVQRDVPTGCPVVWGSRYGEASRSVALLAELANAQPLSPTSFSLSVHNAIGALYAIARGDRANQVSVAAGPATPEACLIEAAGLLADGAPEVLVVCYEAPLPGDYAAFADEPGATWGWAWRVAAAEAGRAHHRLNASASTQPAGAPDTPAPLLPHGLDVLRFLLSPDAVLQHRAQGTCWSWSHHD